MRELAHHSGEGLAEVAARATSDGVIETTWQGQTTQVKVSTFQIQAINHGTEHRANINTILTQLGIEPSIIDGWAYSER